MLLEFISKNTNWKERLSKEPYNLRFNEKENLVLIKYNQLCSDFSNKIVQESRGCIIDINTKKYVCRPFKKFFNIQEDNASIIDWSSARVQDKLDGSILKAWWYNGRWNISTNGMIDSHEAITTSNLYSFYQLFLMAGGNDLPYNMMNKDKTYIFELVSPFQKIVIPYKDSKLYHIGTINNETGQEFNEDIGVEKPKEFRCNNEIEVLKATEKMPFTEEGYVVVDKYWNRVKVKSPEYIKAHRAVGGCLTRNRILETILSGEQSEILSYFPEYTNDFIKIDNMLLKLINKIVNEIEVLMSYKHLNRREFSEHCLKTTIPMIGFKFYENKYIDVNKFIRNMDLNKLMKLLES
jgi:hypothetical protein